MWAWPPRTVTLQASATLFVHISSIHFRSLWRHFLLSIIQWYPESPVSGDYVAHAQTVDTRPSLRGRAAWDRGYTEPIYPMLRTSELCNNYIPCCVAHHSFYRTTSFNYLWSAVECTRRMKNVFWILQQCYTIKGSVSGYWVEGGL